MFINVDYVEVSNKWLFIHP